MPWSGCDLLGHEGELESDFKQDFSNSRVYKGLDGVVDHRLVIGGKQVLIGNPRQWIEPTPVPPARTTPFMM